jgi:hypothetical protein
VAVDYFHFLVVSGPRPAVDDFVHRIALVVTRRVAGVSGRQTVPFSFESLYAMARMKDDDEPGESFDMTRWGIVRRGAQAEVRYRFHTRNVELHPLLKPLSKRLPRLTFALVTQCLDDNDFGAFTIRKGKQRGDWLGDDWRTPFYERAARQYKMTLDEVYEDDDVEAVAEWWMTDAAVQIATGTSRRYDWRSGRVYRDLEDERATAMLELAQAVNEIGKEEKQERPRATARWRQQSKKRKI